ncbi:hypothetical protein CRG98_021114 [Punica granatum]|uniref:Uncharacterized protein n=1 Tax=Punica granatum TaxID=22663 RepID=A0A2I0JQG2_PUNGR|nr:hypothetical protein CRG98_021114 [Punica granatum]
MTGKARNLKRRDLGGFSCAKGTHGHLPCDGAVRLLGPPESLGLFFLEAVQSPNDVRDPPKLESGQGAFGQSPLGGWSTLP